MELIVKKSKDNPTGILTLAALVEKLRLPQLQEDIKHINIKVDNESDRDFTKEILRVYKKLIIDMNNPINIKSSPSIEKNKNIKNGIMYYNEKTDTIRVKTQKGWIDLN